MSCSNRRGRCFAMGDTPRVGLRYCGGCNPRFDRTAFVRKLKDAFPSLSFAYAQEGVLYDTVLVICGCTAICADRTGLNSRTEIRIVRSEADYPAAAALLNSIL